MLREKRFRKVFIGLTNHIKGAIDAETVGTHILKSCAAHFAD